MNTLNSQDQKFNQASIIKWTCLGKLEAIHQEIKI